MNKHMSANTLRFQDVNLGQEGLMKMDNAGMVIPECAFIIKQGDVKKETIAIITMVEKETEMAGHQTQAQTIPFPTISTEIGEIRMFRLRQEIFIKNRTLPAHLILLF